MTGQKPGFTREQQAYLAKEIMQAKLHEAFAPKGAAVAAPEPETYYGFAVEDLCKEEIAKYKSHPLDIWRRLEEWTEANQMAEGLDQFPLRHLGLFNVAPNSPLYMMRLRAPASALTS